MTEGHRRSMAADRHRPARPSRSVAEPPPQAVMGLLNYLTATSLDEDYAHVSARRSASGPPKKGRPGTVALAVLAVFGVLVATAAVQTSHNAVESATSRTSLVGQVHERRAELVQRRAAVQALQREIALLQSRDAAATTQGQVLQSQVTRLGVATGSAPAHGPGIQVVVDDAPGATSFKQRVQAPDVQKLVNGLWQVGAEAVSVNGQRLTTLSSIRDAGSAITVNYVSLRAPYTVSAIGDPATMGARLLDTSGGQTWATLQSSFGLKFDINTKDTMLLPAANRVGLRSAHPPDGRS
jgi:uncharacterized protein YlxW (UPF0749 family)